MFLLGGGRGFCTALHSHFSTGTICVFEMLTSDFFFFFFYETLTNDVVSFEQPGPERRTLTTFAFFFFFFFFCKFRMMIRSVWP